MTSSSMPGILVSGFLYDLKSRLVMASSVFFKLPCKYCVSPSFSDELSDAKPRLLLAAYDSTGVIGSIREKQERRVCGSLKPIDPSLFRP